jgi:serine/threonine protein kinase
MLVLPLCQQFCPDKLPVKTDLQLGQGRDGECLSIVGEPNKVIKLGIMYDQFDNYHQIDRVLKYLQLTQPGMTTPYVKLYDYECLGTYPRPMINWGNGQQEFLLYYYIMEKLEKISEDEKKVFHTILSHEDQAIEKNIDLFKIEKTLQGMSRGLDFNLKRIMLFCEQIKNSKIKHNDLHPRNIMKHGDGDFKAIDLDLCIINN